MAILKAILTVLFVIASLAVIAIVLMQEGKSAGLGSISGASANNDTYWDKNKKHSLEGKFERWTKITAGLFVVIALLLMVMPSSSTNQISTPAVEAPADGANQSATGEGAENTEAKDGAATEVPAEGEAAADGAVEANDAASTQATTEAPAASATTNAN